MHKIICTKISKCFFSLSLRIFFFYFSFSSFTLLYTHIIFHFDGYVTYFHPRYIFALIFVCFCIESHSFHHFEKLCAHFANAGKRLLKNILTVFSTFQCSFQFSIFFSQFAFFSRANLSLFFHILFTVYLRKAYGI